MGLRGLYSKVGAQKWARKSGLRTRTADAAGDVFNFCCLDEWQGLDPEHKGQFTLKG